MEVGESMEEKIKELETELDRVKNALRDSESENVKLKDQLNEMAKGEEKLNLQLKTLQENLEMISAKHKELQTVKEDMSVELQESEEQILDLESKLSESSSLLEEERAKQERRTKATQETSLELKGIMQRSHSKVEDSNRRVNEFEKLLEMEKSRISEFEQEIETLEEKCEKAESEKQKYADLVSDLTAKLDKSQSTETSLKKTLDDKAEKEKYLKDTLSTTQGKLETIQKSPRGTDLGSEQKLQEVVDSFTFTDSDMKSLHQKLEVLKDQIKGYQDQAREAAVRSTALKEDLEQTTKKVSYLETSNEELKKLKEKAQSKVNQSILDNELLIQSNSQLRDQVIELQQRLDSAGTKDGSTMPPELQPETEARVFQVEKELKETNEKLSRKDLEAKDLSERFSSVEETIKGHEIKARESSDIADSRRVELDQARVKVQDQEKEIELLTVKLKNLQVEKDNVTQELDSSKQKIEELRRELALETEKFQSELSSIREKKEQMVGKNVTSQDELQSLLTKLEGQVKEYRDMNETLRDDLEKLTLEEAQNFAARARAKELEEKLKATEAHMKKEVESVQASAAAREADLTSRLEKKAGEQEPISAQDTITQLEKEKNKIASIQESDSKQAFEELEAKNQLVERLEKEVKELQKKIQENGSAKAPGSRFSFKLVFVIALLSIIIGLVINGMD